MVAQNGDGRGQRQGLCCNRGCCRRHLRSSCTAQVSAMSKDTGTRHKQAAPAESQESRW